MQKKGTPHPKAKGRSLVPEHREKISAALKGREFTNIHCQNISLSKKGIKNPKVSQTNKRLYAEGKITPWWILKGLPHPMTTPEARRKDSESHKGQIPWNKGIPWQPKVREKNRLKHLGVKRSLTSRRKQAQTISGENNVSKRPEVAQQISATWKQLIRDGIYNPASWTHRIPTAPELRVIEIIANYHLPYKYVGDGSFTIGTLNPDFCNYNGKKKLIEVFGIVFHDINKTFLPNLPLTAQEPYRKAIYASLGFDCLVLWDDEIKELSDEEIADIIRKFTKSKHKPTAQLPLKVE